MHQLMGWLMLPIPTATAQKLDQIVGSTPAQISSNDGAKLRGIIPVVSLPLASLLAASDWTVHARQADGLSPHRSLACLAKR